jgi:hypothetical protein
MWARIKRLRTILRPPNQQPDAGYASEAVLVTALLIVAALVVIGILVAKITNKANSIDLGSLMMVAL